MFFPAYFFRTDKLTDISYAVTFVVVSSFALLMGGISFPALILFLMVLFWAIRLGSYLLIRIRKIGKDGRFDGMRESFSRFFRFWLLQGFTVWAVLIPALLFFESNPKGILPIAYIGVLIWFIGLLIEAVADYQKYTFINKGDSKGKWIDSGLWKYSRHPNYFGEILLWVGVFIYAIFGLSGYQVIIAAVGPLYIAILIIYVSGIPLLEKEADKRWGMNEDYCRYKSGTSILIPYPPKY